jgi:hypothetical protein
MKRSTQIEVVINRLNKVGYVDNFWAINHYILRLGAVIYLLKRDYGYGFETGFGKTKQNRKNYYYHLSLFEGKR